MKGFYNCVGRFALIISILIAAINQASAQPGPTVCTAQNTETAHVAALDQPIMYNRLGASQPNGMMFALERDIVPMNNPVDQFGNDQKVLVDPTTLKAGLVRLRSDKRPRPMVLRVNKGSCIQIVFRNLLAPNSARIPMTQLETAMASIHLTGLDLVNSITSDGSFAGRNPTSLVAPDQQITYTYYAPDEGTYLLYSTGDLENNNNLLSVPASPQGQMDNGLFGSVTVEPTTAEYYRSQVTRAEMQLAAFFQNSLPANMKLTPKFGPSGARATARIRRSTLSQSAPDSALTREIWVLTTSHPERGTFENADVIVSPDGRLYALDSEDDPRNGEQSGHQLINYGALFPPADPLGRGCTPILKMASTPFQVSGSACAPATGGVQLFGTDLTAMITGPGAGRFDYSENSSTFFENSAEPDRREPYREFTIHYHNPNPVQAFQQFYTPNGESVPGWTQDQNNLSAMLAAGQDGFGINYGIAGIGAEVLANRIGVGPMGNPDAVELKFEEFFLASWAVGDPAMVVDVPANAQNEVLRDTKTPPTYNPGTAKVDNPLLTAEIQGILGGTAGNPVGFTPPVGSDMQRATRAFYPDDPSNVYHSYLRDHVKFRILHAGPGATHVHHLHAHQWLHSPDNDDGDYLDSQMLTPGSSYTLEIAYGGSGNRNMTIGDSIFHCHFYPHFAEGMWSLWRTHDVFEAGTELGANGIPVPGINRALPDGEIRGGTPIPALVPLPELAMAPIPADVRLANALGTGPVSDNRRVEVIPDRMDNGVPVYSNPGYPFFVPGIAGHRSPHPPLDFAWKVDATGAPVLNPQGQKIPLDGGLPRHLVLGGKIFRQFTTRWDFTKDFVLYNPDKTLKDGLLRAYLLPENGTAVERAAMASSSRRTRKSFLPDGDPANWMENGLPPAPGAPFAAPGVTEYGDSNINTRRYQGANIQIDAVLNKKGWHYPQQRMISLWNDVPDTVSGKRAPQPFFFRATTGETIQYWQTNLVPNYYELDDFQVRTPTDIIGQHIHLVKFDVLASDGGSNGFNYEDGTFSPDEVRERVFAIDKAGGLFGFDDGPRQFFNPQVQTQLTVKNYQDEYKNADGSSIFGNAPAGQNWNGAQTTIQLWDSDPLLNNKGVDRTLRTVFTHDHFGPSTHQQTGLYAGLLIEPENSSWFDPSTGQRYYDSTNCFNPTTQTYTRSAGACPANTFRRLDGGPTGWEANIHTANIKDSYREFALEFQDLQLAYLPGSKATVSVPISSVFSGTVANATITMLNGGTVNAEMRTVFAMNGITLTTGATAKAAKGADCLAGTTGANVKWMIHDPNPPDQDEDYCIADRSLTTIVINGPAVTGPVATWKPAMRPSTMDSLNALTTTPVVISGDPVLGGELESDLQSFNIDPNGTGTIAKGTCTIGTVSGKWVIVVTPSTYCVATDPGFTSISALMPDMDKGWQDAANALQPPGAPSSAVTVGPPYPTLVSTGQNGGYSLNYRNEPLPLRLVSGTAGQPNSDLAFGFSSITRGDPALNCQPLPSNPIKNANPCAVATGAGFKFPNYLVAQGQTGPRGTDPFTPLLRAYQGDKIQIRTLVGAHLSLHSFQIPALNWLFEPTAPNSGKRSVQGMGLSEHFEMLFDLPKSTSSAIPGTNPPTASTDYVYETSSGPDGLVNGLWGIMRGFDPSKTPAGGYADLKPLPNNPMPNNVPPPAMCTPTSATTFNVTAVSAQVVYNTRNAGSLVNKNGLLYALSENVTCTGATCTLKSGVPVEPLILRAHAGDCIGINLTNGMAVTSSQNQTATQIRNSAWKNTNPTNLPNVTMGTSPSLGIQPQIIWRDPNAVGGLGLNVGFNNTQTLAVGASGKTVWFAGNSDGTPMEGTILLEPVDPMLQHFWGLLGALILEPKGAAIAEDAGTHATATITPVCTAPMICKAFRELVVLAQSDVQNKFSWGGMNYRTEPFTTPYRFPNAPAATPSVSTTVSTTITTDALEREVTAHNASASVNSLSAKQGDFQSSALDENPEPLRKLLSGAVPAATAEGPIPARYSNTIITTTDKDPETPILHAAPGSPVRVRYLYGGGYTTFMATFDIHGHQFQEEPWTHDSTILGHNPQSQVFGGEQIAPYQTANFLLNNAGGAAHVPGDYIYETFQRANVGTWGLIRVEGTAVVIQRATGDAGGKTATIAGSVTVESGKALPPTVTVTVPGSVAGQASCIAPVSADGTWSCSGPFAAGATVQAGSYKAVVQPAIVQAPVLRSAIQ